MIKNIKKEVWLCACVLNRGSTGGWFAIFGSLSGEKIRQKNRRHSQIITETLKIQLDNVTRKLQALQVENARLWEANPKLTSVIDAEHSNWKS